MKRTILTGLTIMSIIMLSGCGASDNAIKETENKTATKVEEKVEAPKGPVPFADINTDVMDAYSTYKISFTQGEGTCMDQGFPTNLVYGPKNNIIKTEDEKYVEDMTAVDFTGTIRFDQLTLSTGSASCVMKTVKGINTANVTCSVAEKEVCIASFKLTAEKV
jgi:hypothetical protein